MTEISNHPYHFSVPAPKDSPYAKYDMSRPQFSPVRAQNNVKIIARDPREQTIVADGKVDVNDVGGLLLTGRKDEVDGLIEQLKTDGKLTEAEKVERIKADFENDRELYGKNFDEWRNSDDVRGKDFGQWAAKNKLFTPSNIENKLDLSWISKIVTQRNNINGIDGLFVESLLHSEARIQDLNKRIEELEKRLEALESQNQAE
ncbi:MAG: hypothetical protein LBL50_04100 [Candidatus Margulisbacteria bacterium]|jgi:hypothetical protein|nr:hypothetical protein [Candidatus Margulisiibacteriota bacterium]